MTMLQCPKCLTYRTDDVLGGKCRTEGCDGIIAKISAFATLVDELPEPMRCPRRDENPQVDYLFPGPDNWKKFKRINNRVCSYCGSLHPEDMFRLVAESATAPLDADYAETVNIERAEGKSYKFYVRQPGVRNASEGGIKFYTMHLPRDDEGKIIVTPQQNDELRSALEGSHARFVRSMTKK